MAESILGYFLILCVMGYGLCRFVLAVVAEEEKRRRAGELAWQEWERA